MSGRAARVQTLPLSSSTLIFLAMAQTSTPFSCRNSPLEPLSTARKALPNPVIAVVDCPTSSHFEWWFYHILPGHTRGIWLGSGERMEYPVSLQWASGIVQITHNYWTITLLTCIQLGYMLQPTKKISVVFATKCSFLTRFWRVKKWIGRKVKIHGFWWCKKMFQVWWIDQHHAGNGGWCPQTWCAWTLVYKQL